MAQIFHIYPPVRPHPRPVSLPSASTCCFRGNRWELQMGNRGRINDKWSMRVLWLTAIGSAVGLYMVAVERQTQNREKMMAEALRAQEAEANNGGTV